jgi:hypothetical protein
MGAVRSRLRRWHVWLGWLVGIPILLWVVSGLFMVSRPMEEVRGEDLVRQADPVRISAPLVLPPLQGAMLTSLALEQRASGPRWVITLADGKKRLADPWTGALLPALSAADAVREVEALYTGKARITGTSRTSADNPPLELRRPIDSWKVTFDDGTNFYVDAATGQIVARRTRWWRAFDLMWGLHIMDLKTREEIHNPLVIGFAIFSLLMALLALALLPMTIKWRRRAGREG